MLRAALVAGLSFVSVQTRWLICDGCSCGTKRRQNGAQRDKRLEPLSLLPVSLARPRSDLA